MSIIDEKTDLLLAIDVQNDFMPGGRLPVPQGDQIIPVINELLRNYFCQAVATQDWHPTNHVSFASQHLGTEAFQSIQLPYGEQTLCRTTVCRERRGLN